MVINSNLKIREIKMTKLYQWNRENVMDALRNIDVKEKRDKNRLENIIEETALTEIELAE
ncbi:hypothetical protein A6U95_07625 [Serratia sp. 14-2641]|nr:hypothetical protein A6U95_07625 [Serratia sp. 14-2641]